MATSVTEQANLTVLEAFVEAGNRHDLDTMMALMADDCVFNSSFGPGTHGTRYEGHDQVREALKWFLVRSSDGQWTELRHFVSGDRGVSEWTYRGTEPDGTLLEVAGCDIVTFRDGKIVLKDSFRKNRTLG